MKWALVTLNTLAAAGLFFLGGFAMGTHRTHGYSMYREFQERGVLNERPDYSVEKRMREIAAGGSYYMVLSLLSAGVCLANAIAIGIWFTKPKPNASAPPDNRQP